MHTPSFVNYYTHGTQVTAAHGHLAFFGAYVCLNLAIMTYAMPYLRGREPYNQVLNMISFWVMAGGMVFMTIVLTFAGVIQTHLQRVRGEAYMEVQDQIALFYQMRLLAGIIAVVGVVIYLYAILVPRRDELITRHSLHPAE
jgi:nitric oxide reductase subunit B